MPRRNNRPLAPRQQPEALITGVSVASGDQSPPTKDSTQREIGLLYVRSFVIIIMGVLFFSFVKSYDIFEIKDILLAVSGILSGPLGFIIGFYFKEELQNKNNV